MSKLQGRLIKSEKRPSKLNTQSTFDSTNHHINQQMHGSPLSKTNNYNFSTPQHINQSSLDSSSSQRNRIQKKYISNFPIYEVNNDHEQKIQIKSNTSRVSSNHSQLPPNQTLTLQEKIIQNSLRLKDQDYQNVLIQQKQLQIQLISQQSQQKKLHAQFKKMKKEIFKKKQQLTRAQSQLKTKKQYLKRYYQHLEKKFNQSNSITKSINQKITKLDIVLEEKYQQQLKNFSMGKQELEQKYQQLKKYHNKILQQYQQISNEIKQFKRSEDNSQVKIFKQKLTKKQQNQIKKEDFKKTLQKIELEKQKKMKLQNQQKLLKKILNIQQQHKKYSMIIQNGIKKLFKIKTRELLYKNAVGLQYGDKLEDLKKIMDRRKAQKIILERKLQNKQKQKLNLKHIADELVIEYSQLEHKIINEKNKKN